MIYLDNAATTKVCPTAVEAMLPYFTENYGNPSTIYTLGTRAKKAINESRRQIAELIHAGQREIFFTAGGTESDNWALIGTAEKYAGKGKHIITSAIEHHAILHTCEYLESRGYEITYLPVDETGLVRVEDVQRAIRPDTILISIMFANNEIGTIEPIREIGAVARQAGILFHTDAVQAFGQIPIDVQEMNIDMLSASSHKINGPKGSGILYIREGIEIPAWMHGGAQERNRRAGTENVPAIVGFGAAARHAAGHMEEKRARVEHLREELISKIEQRIPDCHLNGHREKRLPGNVNFSFRGVEGETLLIMLDMKGIYASSGSACTSGAIDPSHVLRAIGLDEVSARGSLRMTLSEENTSEELECVAQTLEELVGKIRDMRNR